uniref:Uncharacterized protein n=1 Tax=Populus trichocarpa TaxID=3694 RepID=A0A2K2CD71_POPTR
MQEIVIADFSCLSLILCGVPCKSLFFSLLIHNFREKKTFTDHSFRLMCYWKQRGASIMRAGVKVIFISLPFLSLFASWLPYRAKGLLLLFLSLYFIIEQSVPVLSAYIFTN